MRVRHPLFYLSGALAVFACLTGCGGGGTPMITIGGGDAKYVAVGPQGKIYYSSDAVTWKAAVSGTTEALNDVVWNGKVFCAVGVGGTVLHSSNGETWIPSLNAPPTQLNAVAANGSGLICAVGEEVSGHSVVALSSDDGATWTLPAVPSNLNKSLKGICWDGDRFTAVGVDGFTTVSRTGGPLWEVPISTTPAPVLLGVVPLPSLGSEARLALGSTGAIFQSTGYSLTWTNPATIDMAGFMPRGIASSGSRAVVSGLVNDDGGRLFSATAPGIWTQVWEDRDKNHALAKVIWDGSRFIAVGSNGSVVVSSDGTAALGTWTYHAIPSGSNLTAIAARP